jgi:hypothetical protein
MPYRHKLLVGREWAAEGQVLPDAVARLPQHSRPSPTFRCVVVVSLNLDHGQNHGIRNTADLELFWKMMPE